MANLEASAGGEGSPPGKYGAGELKLMAIWLFPPSRNAAGGKAQGRTERRGMDRWMTQDLRLPVPERPINKSHRPGVEY